MLDLLFCSPARCKCAPVAPIVMQVMIKYCRSWYNDEDEAYLPGTVFHNPPIPDQETTDTVPYTLSFLHYWDKNISISRLSIYAIHIIMVGNGWVLEKIILF